MNVNRRRLSLREGSVFVNGFKVMDSVKFEVTYTPEVAQSRSLGERGKSSRWLGRDIKVVITEYRSTPWIKDAAMSFENTGKTPEYTIQGLQRDEGSDYFESNGSSTVTLLGCVPTGDMPLISLDSEGEHVQDEIEFSAHHMV